MLNFCNYSWQLIINFVICKLFKWARTFPLKAYFKLKLMTILRCAEFSLKVRRPSKKHPPNRAANTFSHFIRRALPIQHAAGHHLLKFYLPNFWYIFFQFLPYSHGMKRPILINFCLMCHTICFCLQAQ